MHSVQPLWVSPSTYSVRISPVVSTTGYIAYAMPGLSRQKYLKYFIHGMPAWHVSATDVGIACIIYSFSI